MEIFRHNEGASALVVSMPHVGTHVPPEIAVRLTDAALTLPDTDWHIDRLYDFLGAFGASVIQATHSRYVIDLNRPPDNTNLYPGQDTTALVPIDTGDRSSLYQGDEPDEREIAERRARYWQPYHDALAAMLAATQKRHGYALLWDAHSIKSTLPRFFTGQLPDLNLGTADGQSCGTGLGERLLDIARSNTGYTSVLNGRYKGGYITRQYGHPVKNIHAVQLELSWRTYMTETHPFPFREDLARGIRALLRDLVGSMVEWGKARYGR